MKSFLSGKIYLTSSVIQKFQDFLMEVIKKLWVK